MRNLLLRGGTVVDGAEHELIAADVAVAASRVVAVGPSAADRAGTDAVVVDCAGRLVLPGFVDTHSHADGQVFDEDVQDALLAQGITTIIAGQDGVSFAPGTGVFASEYFAAINGAGPVSAGAGVAGLLAGYDGTTPVNVAYLVPAGTVRHEVVGSDDRPATEAERATMRRLITEGLAAGAVGVSTGLDYTPGMFADTAELADLARPLKAAAGVYVTHMRWGYEANVAQGIDEVVAIGRDAGGVRTHVSHLHGPPDAALAALSDAEARGCDLTFDAYPYRAGCTILAMALLPPDVQRDGRTSGAAQLADSNVRRRIVEQWLPQQKAAGRLDADWADRMTLAHVASPQFAWAHGLTVAAAADRRGLPPALFALEILAASRLEVTAVMRVPSERTVDDLARLMRHPGYMAGSDGIFVGASPHPRAWGAMARILARHVRERGDLTWAQAADALATRPARRFGLGRRGRVAVGWVADLLVVDPASVRDVATYAQPRRPAQGIEDVIVNGVLVRRAGRRTGALAGIGVRRANRSVVDD